METKIVLDYKFSLFGDFSNLYKNASQLLTLNFFKKHSIERTKMLPNDIPSPVYLLESDLVILRISISRVDVCFKTADSNDETILLQVINVIDNYLPAFLKRVAINYSFNLVDDDFKFTNSIGSKLTFLSNGNYPKDFNVTQVYKIYLNSVESNNILSIQTANMIDKTTFISRRVLACAFDINTSPSIDDSYSQFLAKEEIIKLFRDAKNILNNDINTIGILVKNQ